MAKIHIVPEKPRSVAAALAVAEAAKPGHILIAWSEDTEGEEVTNLLTATEDGEGLSEAEVVYLCERVKAAVIGQPEHYGPTKVRS